MSKGNVQASAVTTEELVISRTFNAPKELIWKVFTEPQHLVHWWGPKGFVMDKAKIDLRVGGLFHYHLQAPDGSEMWGKLVYREVSAPDKMVTVLSFSDEKGGTTVHPMAPTWPRELLVDTRFEEKDGKTTVTLRVKPINATTVETDSFDEGRESMRQGFKGSFDQLDNYLDEPGNK